MTTRTVILTGYVVLGVALLTLVLLSHRRPTAVATVSELADMATRRRIGRVIALLVWWWVGFHVLSRSA